MLLLSAFSRIPSLPRKVKLPPVAAPAVIPRLVKSIEENGFLITYPSDISKPPGHVHIHGVGGYTDHERKTIERTVHGDYSRTKDETAIFIAPLSKHHADHHYQVRRNAHNLRELQRFIQQQPQEVQEMLYHALDNDKATLAQQAKLAINPPWWYACIFESALEDHSIVGIQSAHPGLLRPNAEATIKEMFRITEKISVPIQEMMKKYGIAGRKYGLSGFSQGGGIATILAAYIFPGMFKELITVCTPNICPEGGIDNKDPALACVRLRTDGDAVYKIFENMETPDAIAAWDFPGGYESITCVGDHHMEGALAEIFGDRSMAPLHNRAPRHSGRIANANAKPTLLPAA